MRIEKLLRYNYDIMKLNEYHSEIVEEVLNRWLLMFLEENKYEIQNIFSR